MREENKKEILTREIIKSEIKNISKDTMLSTIPLFVLSVFLLGLLILLNKSKIGSSLGIMFFVFFGLVFIFAICTIIYQLLYSISAYNAAKNDAINIVVDKLLNKNDIPLYYKPYALIKTTFNISLLTFGRKVMCFGLNKIYNVPIGKNYAWSEKNSMDYKGVCRSSQVGDEFYLAVVENKKVILAYNTKFFELQQ